jgi:hypothetical protein
MGRMFLRNLLALVFALVLAVSLSLILNNCTALVSKNWPYGLLFLTVLCFSLNLVYARRASSDTFTQLLIGSVVIKLLAGLTFIVVYSLIYKSDFFNFSVHFIGHYILFTIFEIRYLLFLIKKQPNP